MVLNVEYITKDNGKKNFKKSLLQLLPSVIIVSK